MIQAALYQTIYMIVVTILTVISVNKYNQEDDSVVVTSDSSDFSGYILAIALSIFIGFRPISGRYFVDMYNYFLEYYYLYFNVPFEFNNQLTNLFFDNLFMWLASEGIDISVFFVIIATIYFVFSYFAISKLFPGHAFLAYIVFLGAFSTFSYATNGIKAGAAATFFLCALAYWQNRLVSLLFLFLSFSFHHSMVLPIAAFIAAIFEKRSKYYFYFWGFALLMALAHITFFQEIFAGLSDEGGANYLNNTAENWGGKTGFRFDFVLYSSLPVYIGYITLFKYKLESKTYSFLLNVYLMANAIWMLCMYAAFTNRIAYLSWLMYPIVTIYPFLCPTFMPEQKKRLKQVVWFQLLFTLFMNIVYYG